MGSSERRGLLELFWELAEASPKRRTQAACDLVRHLLQGGQAEDNTQGHAQSEKGKKQLPGVAAVDAHKMLSMLTPPEGTTAVPYDLQYAVNRLFQGLASPRPCTRQAYALALLLLLLQLQQQKPAIAGVNLLSFCQNLRRVFTVKQAAPSEVKQLHLGRCLGVYILLCLGFFKKKQSLPEVQEVLEMLWQAFHGKLQLQEASGSLIRKVLRQLGEVGKAEIGLATCESKLRGVGIPHLLEQMETMDKTKAAQVGKTATGRLPCSLLEVYVHLQADMQEGLLPDAEWLHTDVFSLENLPRLAAFLSDTAAAHPRLHGLWSGVMRLLLLQNDAEEIFQRFWVAVDARLFPYKRGESDGPDTESKKPQEQSHQSAFVGFRAALLTLHVIKQRLLLRESADDSALTEAQLQRMASLVFTKGKGFVRVLLFHLESPRSPLHAVARYTAERLEEVFGNPIQLGAARRHPLSVSSSNGDGGDRGFVRTRQLSSMCCLSCGCQADPYVHGLLEPLLEETRDEAEHLQPFGEDYRGLGEPLRLQPDERVAMLLAFGVACRFQPLKRQSLWSLGSICFSSAQPDELKGLAMLLLAALNEAPPNTTALAEGEKGLVGRRAMWLLDCLLLLPQLLGSKNAEGSAACLPDWLLAAALCSSSFAVRIVPKALSQSQILTAAVEPSELSEASQPAIPKGMDDVGAPAALVQLPELFLFGLGISGLNGTKHISSKGAFLAFAASSRIRGKICHLLGNCCSTAMERCTRMDGDVSSDFARHLHGAHALLFELIEKEKEAGKGEELQLSGRAISVGERGRKAMVRISSNGGSAMKPKREDMDELQAACYFASSQGAAVAAAANAAAERNGGTVHAGFMAATQILCIAICTLSLLPYLLLPGGNDGSRASGEGNESEEEDGTELDETEEDTGINGAAVSAAKAFAAPATKVAGVSSQDESEEVLDAALHALRQMMQVIKPLYTYVHLGDQKDREAAIAAQVRAAAISSNLLLLGGSSAASGLLREVAGGLWRCFSCFAPTGSITKLLGVATATSSAPDDAEEESLEGDEGEPETASESEESEEASESSEDEQQDESSSQKQKLSAERTKSKRNNEDGGASSSSDESDGEDPFALQLSPDAALEALADDAALPDAYCPPGGFKDSRISQRKLLLQQRRRFGELRLRALGALQVYVQYNSNNPLALHVLTSLYAAFSRVLVQAAQSRKRKQNLAVYDDLKKKIRRTIELALKGTISNAWQVNSSSTVGSNDSSKPHRKTSSISLCYQTLQEQRLQVLLEKTARGAGQKEQKRKLKDTNHQLQIPPLMPTLEDGDRVQVLLEGKQKNALLCDSPEAAEEAQIQGSAEHKKCLFLAQTLWVLLAEEMLNVLRVCSRRLPPQLAGLNQTLGVEILLQLSKLEQQVYGYYAASSLHNPAVAAAVSNKETIVAQLLSIALSARSKLRRCHLGGSFFETLAERRPDFFRFCDVYAAALQCRAPFARRELAQVAFRAFKQPFADHPGGPGVATEELDVQVLQKRLSADYVLTSLLAWGRSGEVARKRLLAAFNCEPILTPNKALRSSADFAVFVVRRLVGLLKETSEAEVRPPQQQQETDGQQQKRRKKRQQPDTRTENTEDATRNEDHPFMFSSIAQKQATVCEHLKQLKQLLQTFARRDRQEASASEGQRELKGFKEKLQGYTSSIEQTLVSAAEATGGKKSSNLANTIRALLSRITGADWQDNSKPLKGDHRAKTKWEAADETGKRRKKHKGEQRAKDGDSC